jgi:acetyltransferase
LQEFFGILSLASFSDEIENNKVAVVTNAGGVGVLTSDAFNGKNIELADFDDETKKELQKVLPEESSVENPIDLLGDAKADRYAKVLRVISKVKKVGSVICLLTAQEQTPVEEIAREIIKFKKETNKIVVAVFIGGDKVEKSIALLKQNEIASFDFPDLAISALDSYCHWNERKKMKEKTATQMINQKRREKVLKIIEGAKSQHREALYFRESAKVMDLYGIETVESFDADNFQKEKLSYPVVLKIDSDKVLHKTDKGGLILGIENEENLTRAISQMKTSFPGSRFIIQPMTKSGAEIIVGIKRDENFGPVVVYGLGGIYTEILKTVDYVVPPLALSQIERSLEEGKIKFLFQGVRGQKKYDLQELSRILIGVSSMSLEIPEISEFDINPLIVYNNGNEALALDVKIII